MLTRPQRVNWAAKKLALRHEKQQAKAEAEGKPKKRRQALRLRERKKARLRPMIAYDLETTSFSLKGKKTCTPSPLFITAFSEDLGIQYAIRIDPAKPLKHLCEILENRFLIDDFIGARFVGWNANNYDVYFICAALLHSDTYIIRPYLTKNKKVRGARISLKSNDKISWEFLDGMSMTGITKKLKDFLTVFAPEHGKLGSPDFENEGFNADNPKHVEYALRDSVGLWHGMKAAEKIVADAFNIGLQPTVGNMGIKVFTAHIPRDVTVWPLPFDVLHIVRDYVMRGGFCYCTGLYHGPVWKYDINQAYAAAMRDCWLPAGNCQHTQTLHRFAKAAIYQINATNKKNTVPFYWRDLDKKARFDTDNLRGAWLTSIEVNQLISEGWKVEILEGYYWNDHFRMKSYVDELEDLRINGPGGPKSAQGEMMKSIGNNSYGKTVEQLDGLEIVMAKECPEGFSTYQDEDDLFSHLWFSFSEPQNKNYHQPHLGAFITAQVRMVLRRAILQKPESWLYADTDGVMFSVPVPLALSATKYGAWKQEADGEIYRIITKKVYANNDASEKHAKGININRLTNDDFIEWFNGNPPKQKQAHRSNLLNVMAGGEMFYEHEKVGQRVAK
jgi:hypothetical protein